MKYGIILDCINSLRGHCTPDQWLELQILRGQLNTVRFYKFTTDYLREYIQQENDIIDSGFFVVDSLLYDSIRMIQTDIINNFGKESQTIN